MNKLTQITGTKNIVLNSAAALLMTIAAVGIAIILIVCIKNGFNFNYSFNL